MSFYTSLNGLKNAQTDLGVISNNIANAETNGFKKSTVAFADIVAGSAFTNPKLILGIGATVEAINQNFAQGPVEQTGNALDLVVNGDGFFTTRSAISGDTLFTRNGSFEIDENGYLVRGNGNRLQVFATDASDQIAGSHVGLDDFGHGAQHMVSCGVSVGVVEVLELVHVLHSALLSRELHIR